MTFSEAIQQILGNLNYYGIRKETYLVIISISILAIIVGITMLIKRKLGKAEIF